MFCSVNFFACFANCGALIIYYVLQGLSLQTLLHSSYVILNLGSTKLVRSVPGSQLCCYRCICCKSVQPVPARVEEPVSPVWKSSPRCPKPARESRLTKPAYTSWLIRIPPQAENMNYAPINARQRKL